MWADDMWDLLGDLTDHNPEIDRIKVPSAKPPSLSNSSPFNPAWHIKDFQKQEKKQSDSDSANSKKK